MAREFSMQFTQMMLTEGQMLLFEFTDAKAKKQQLKLIIVSLEGAAFNKKPVKVRRFLYTN